MKVLLKDIADIKAGQGAPQGDEKYSTNGIPFIKAGNLHQLLNGFSVDKLQKVSNDVASQYKLKLYPKGTILFAKSGMSCMKGYVYVLPCNAYVVNHLACIIPYGNYSEYLKYYLNYHKPSYLIKDNSYPSISLKDIGNQVIDFKSKKIQKEIIKQMKLLEQNISCLKIVGKKYDDLIKARFIEMFGDPYTNPLKWEKLKIKDAVTVEPQNGLYKPQSDYVTDRSGIPILRIDGFYDGIVTDFASLKRLKCSETEKQKYLLLEDDIVINRVNSIEYLGKCAHIKGLLEDTVYESNMMRMHFDPESYNPAYICKLLCSQFIYDQIVNHAKKAVNQASINQKDVLDFNIYQPPVDLQNQFADFVQQVDKSKYDDMYIRY